VIESDDTTTTSLAYLRSSRAFIGSDFVV